MAVYIGHMCVLGEFIIEHYSHLYKKKELSKIEPDEVYEVRYFEVPEEIRYKPPPAFSVVYFNIPEISDGIKQFTFNTSSIYALELCNYDFVGTEDDEQED
jgi:hypothetical protein